MTNVAPNLCEPLIHEPEQSSPAPNDQAAAADGRLILSQLAHLIGTWTNQNLPGTSAGGPEKPYSYCVMPLPEDKLQDGSDNKDGYILKNFSYYEELTFSAINGTAPNRGGTVTQVSNTLFYEQRVYFSDGPNKDALVHAENGSLLFLTDQAQQPGPYGDGNGPDVVNNVVTVKTPATQQFNLVKQMSVPHGNSILAEGFVKPETGSTIGAPKIPDSSAVYPTNLPPGVTTDQYKHKSVGNLDPAFTANPNLPLQQAIASPNPQPTHFIQLTVDNRNGKHNIDNIAFEQKHCEVSQYTIDYWLESFEGDTDDKGEPVFNQLQYSQTVMLDILLHGKDKVMFPHPLTNTLRRKT
ncbi:MAG: hypothetical protein HRT35_02105 [Algicola sp.]|nr:hypothetical protein [Algicola sp.]